jgi:hypothetical protein
MSLQKKIDELLNKKEKIALEESKRLVDVFRKNIKSFNRLVQAYASHKGHEEFKGGAYTEISKLLAEEGITKRNGQNISTAQIAKCLRQVRIESGFHDFGGNDKKKGSSMGFKLVKEEKSEKNVSDGDDRWVKILYRLSETMELWTLEDKKDYFDLEKIKSKGSDLTSDQLNCYDRLLRKKENSGH